MSRQCAGTYSNGGSWSQADYTQRAILSSEVTGHLCASALVCTVQLYQGEILLLP